jgi:predicted lipoprotein with Yx(FWY)xxD motif
MKLLNVHRAWILPAAAAVAVALTGCAAESEGGGAAAGGSSADLVSVASVDGIDVLVDDTGRTLYTAEVEKSGEILCVDACASFWEPMTGTDADLDAVSPDLRDELEVVQRPDGDSQLAYRGLPLYTFAEEGAGELTGDGFTDDFQGTHFEWAAATDRSSAPSGTPGSDSDDLGDSYGY